MRVVGIFANALASMAAAGTADRPVGMSDEDSDTTVDQQGPGDEDSPNLPTGNLGQENVDGPN